MDYELKRYYILILWFKIYFNFKIFINIPVNENDKNISRSGQSGRKSIIIENDKKLNRLKFSVIIIIIIIR